MKILFLILGNFLNKQLFQFYRGWFYKKAVRVINLDL